LTLPQWQDPASDEDEEIIISSGLFILLLDIVQLWLENSGHRKNKVAYSNLKGLTPLMVLILTNFPWNGPAACSPSTPVPQTLQNFVS
jgi:hypothetical protein